MISYFKWVERATWNLKSKDADAVGNTSQNQPFTNLFGGFNDYPGGF